MNAIRSNRSFQGFTLVELLVVIAIIGVLVALLLPAVQAAREAARRSQCVSQLRQMALGAMNHHDAHKHFPTGGWGWLWIGDPDRGFGEDQPGGWIYNTLPYIEEGNLHGLASDGDRDVITDQQRDGAMRTVSQPITIINCPSRRPSQAYPFGLTLRNSNAPPAVGRSDYAINSGTLQPEINAGPSSLEGADNFQWEKDKPNSDRILNGVAFQASEIGVHQITDGTSNTYFAAEKHLIVPEYETGNDPGDNETWCTGYNNDLHRITRSTPIKDGADASVPDRQSRFGSAHSSTWNVAFCDGSVRGVTYDINLEVHQALSTRDGGETISDGAF